MPKLLRDHITRTPGVCGGKACIAGHRIRVMDIVHFHEQSGWSVEKIIEEFPGIDLGDVYSALAYYYDNRDEIDGEMRREKEAVAKFRRTNKSLMEERAKGRGDSH